MTRKLDPGTDPQFVVRSPSRPQTVDWGLQAGTDYHYRVTAVDRQGNESAPCPLLRIATVPIDRVLLELQADATWPGESLRQIPFDLPSSGEYAVWLQAEPSESVRSGRSGMDWRLDDGEWRSTRLWFAITSKGHAGSTPGVAFWDLLRVSSARSPMPISAGAHALTLRAPSIRACRTRRVVITNDLGYEPDGMTSWLGVDVW